MKFVIGRRENIVGKGQNAGYQYFLLFPTMFSKSFFSRIIKSRDCASLIALQEKKGKEALAQ